MRWGLVVLGLAVAAVLLWLAVGGKKPVKPQGPPTVAVTTAAVSRRDAPIAINALGAARAWQSVLIRAQISGRLTQVAVREGSEVKAGDLIAEIDPAPFRAALMQAQGALARDSALLETARRDLKRYRQLAAQDSIAGQQVDTQEGLVKQNEGLVMIDQGAVATAKVNLGYTRILSPAPGRVGVRLVDAGNLVSASDTTGIVTINQVTPIAVTFTAPQGDFQRLSDASNGFRRPMAVEAFSQESGASLGAGELSIADNHVDAATGTVQLKARFANDDRRLWPGQLVNVRLVVQTLRNAIVAPASAINPGPNGPFAYVVGADGKASVRPVSVITTQDGVAVIKTGLNPGEIVVTDGQLSLKPGASVRDRSALSSAKRSSP